MPADRIDVQPGANGGGLGLHSLRHRRQQLAKGAFRCGGQRGMPQRTGLRHKQRAQLGIVQAGNLGAPALGQLPPALGAAQRDHGNPGSAQRLHIAMRSALRSFQPLGQLAGGETPVRLQ